MCDGRRWRPALLIGALVIIAVVPASAEARVWTVRTDGTGDFTLIQEAIASAEHGDEVLVGPGTYDENLDFLGKRIAVRSEAGPEATTIDGGERQLSVVVFQSGELRDSRLEGFTITGGLGHPRLGGVATGGGVLIVNSGPTIVGNRIVRNSARGLASVSWFGYGGAVYCAVANVPVGPLLFQNTIEFNSAPGDGGGIGIGGNGPAVISMNHIRYNETDGDGGGVWVLSNRGGMTLSDNIIAENVAEDHGGGFYEGSVVQGTYFTSTVTRNLFYRNRANQKSGTGTSGGGLWVSASACRVVQNTFVGNWGGGGGAGGGNIAIEEEGTPYFERNIIALAASGGGVACTGGTSTFVNNIVWQNAGGDGTGLCSDWYATGGNMVVDPLLCHPDIADASVAENSPALTSPVGIIGANPTPGCPGVAIEPTTWSRIKVLLGR